MHCDLKDSKALDPNFKGFMKVKSDQLPIKVARERIWKNVKGMRLDSKKMCKARRKNFFFTFSMFISPYSL